MNRETLPDPEAYKETVDTLDIMGIDVGQVFTSEVAARFVEALNRVFHKEGE